MQDITDDVEAAVKRAIAQAERDLKRDEESHGYVGFMNTYMMVSWLVTFSHSYRLASLRGYYQVGYKDLRILLPLRER